MVKLLLSKFDFTASPVERNEYSILTLAILIGNIAIVNLLVNANMFDLNMIDGHGQGPL